MKKSFITLFIFVLAISVEAQSFWKNKKVKGSGDVTTVTRNTKDYEGISIDGFFDIILKKGGEGKINIEAQENLIEYIVTEVSKGTLKIKTKQKVNLSTTRIVTITIPVEHINKVSLGGSGNVKSETVLKSDDFKVNLNGSGDIHLEVEADKVISSVAGSGDIYLEVEADKVISSVAGSGDIHLEVEADEIISSVTGSGDIKLSGKAGYMETSVVGSGDINAFDLQTDTIKTTITGPGSIKVKVKKKIDAKTVGSGNIYYKGNPTEINTKIVGSGNIIRVD